MQYLIDGSQSSYYKGENSGRAAARSYTKRISQKVQSIKISHPKYREIEREGYEVKDKQRSGRPIKLNQRDKRKIAIEVRSEARVADKVTTLEY